MTKYSVIVPVYNRPQEVDELLESLTKQTFKNFEVIIVEDGSTKDAAAIVNKYLTQLNVHYFTKSNSGPGPSRNLLVALLAGAAAAAGAAVVVVLVGLAVGFEWDQEAAC